MHALRHLIIAAAPLLLASAYGLYVLRSHLTRPEGDQQILLAAPLFAWALVYFLSHLVFWWRKSTLRRSMLFSAAIATGLVAFLYAAFIALALLTGAGRQMVG